MTTAAPLNGCHNRPPFKAIMMVADRVKIPFRMAPDCRYTHTALGQADQRCRGCCWRVEPAPPAPVQPLPPPPMKDQYFRPW